MHYLVMYQIYALVSCVLDLCISQLCNRSMYWLVMYQIYVLVSLSDISGIVSASPNGSAFFSYLYSGFSVGLDVCSVHHNNYLLRYTLSFLGYGFFGDVVKESENYRWMGTNRYGLAGEQCYLLPSLIRRSVCGAVRQCLMSQFKYYSGMRWCPSLHTVLQQHVMVSQLTYYSSMPCNSVSA